MCSVNPRTLKNWMNQKGAGTPARGRVDQRVRIHHLPSFLEPFRSIPVGLRRGDLGKVLAQQLRLLRRARPGRHVEMRLLGSRRIMSRSRLRRPPSHQRRRRPNSRSRAAWQSLQWYWKSTRPRASRSARGSVEQTAPSRSGRRRALADTWSATCARVHVPPSRKPVCSKRRHLLGQDLVAEHDVVDDVGFADRLANELAGGNGPETEQQQHARKARRKPTRIADTARNTAPRTRRRVIATIKPMKTLSTAAEGRTAMADGGSITYQPAPPSVIRIAPSRAGRMLRRLINSRSFASLSTIEACRYTYSDVKQQRPAGARDDLRNELRIEEGDPEAPVLRPIARVEHERRDAGDQHQADPRRRCRRSSR